MTARNTGTYVPAPARGACPSGKIQFASRKQARRNRRRIADSSLSAYLCPECGWFHLGHQPKTVRRGTYDKAKWQAQRKAAR